MHTLLDDDESFVQIDHPPSSVLIFLVQLGDGADEAEHTVCKTRMQVDQFEAQVTENGNDEVV